MVLTPLSSYCHAELQSKKKNDKVLFLSKLVVNLDLSWNWVIFKLGCAIRHRTIGGLLLLQFFKLDIE